MREDNGAAELEARYDRIREGMQFIQLMSRAFSSLTLTERSSLGDTLGSLAGTFFDCTTSLVVLADPDTGEPAVAACQGIDDEEALGSETAGEFYRQVMEEKIAQAMDGDEVMGCWPGAPEKLRQGLACVAIDLMDEPVGLLMVAGRRSGEPFTQEDLTFLSSAAGLGAMAVSNATAHEEQQAQKLLAEARAELAAHETDQKEKVVEELNEKIAIIEQQQVSIMELSTPVLQIWEDVIALPIIGVVDTRRSTEIMERLMEEITRRQSRFVILDITGVEVVDTKTADHFIKVARAAELLGARCIVTGIRPAVAQTLVDIGVDLSSIITESNMQKGLALCLKLMKREGRSR